MWPTSYGGSFARSSSPRMSPGCEAHRAPVALEERDLPAALHGRKETLLLQRAEFVARHPRGRAEVVGRRRIVARELIEVERTPVPRHVRRVAVFGLDGLVLLHRHRRAAAAVHVEDAAGHVRGPRRREERDQPGDLVGRADALHRDRARHLRPLRVVHRAGPAAAEDRAEARRVDAAGADGVHGDAFRGDFQRQRLGVADHPGPGRHRQAELRNRLQRRQRRDVDDATPAASAHARQHAAREPHDAHQVLLDRARPRDVVERVQRARAAARRRC